MDRLLSEKSTILAVDDTPGILSLIMELLKDEYNLKLINSPKKAIEFLQNNHKIDLILLDVMMPEIDGYELCKVIKQNPFYAKTPVVFLTALEKTSDIVKGFECGAVDYVTKPFIPEVLKARIKTHTQLKLLYDAMAKELQEKEDLLYRQSRMTTLGEMFENVTHQWKQPLSTINMSCSTLQMSCDFDELNIEGVSSVVETILSETEHLAQTLDDFRDFAKNDDETESFNIRLLFEHALEILSFRFVKTKIEVANNIENFRYRSHKNYIIQIILNILNNAVDVLADKEGERWIRADSMISAKEIVLRICDNGGGIKMEDADMVFAKYVSTKRNDEYSGIGLYMCRQIMQKKLGAQIRAYNSTVGACFELVFPIVQEEDKL